MNRLFSRKSTKYVAIGASAITAASASYYYSLDKDDGLRRNVRLYSHLTPILIHYRLTGIKHRLLNTPEDVKKQELKHLHEIYSTRALAAIHDLRGWYVKMGQQLANRNDILSEEYIEKLRQLEDKVPPSMTGEEARGVIKRALGLKSLDDVFLDFSDEPIGSASIGQVHKATLKSNGKTVAIKVQSPNAEQLFKNDVSAAKGLFTLFVPDQSIFFDEIEKQFANEFDYVVEAKHLNRMHNNMTPVFGNLVVVPRAYKELCTREVLTMEYLKGIKLVDGVRDNAREWCERNGTTLEALEAEMKEKYSKETFKMPPPYNGPSATVIGLYIGAIKTGDALVNIPVTLHNWTLGYLVPSWKVPYYKSFIPLNTARIMDTLLSIHGHQLFVDGFMNADPHPGNFLLLEDGRLGLLDMGQVKELSTKERVWTARMYKALADQDQDAIKTLAIEMGYSSKKLDKEVMFKLARFSFDQDGEVATDGEPLIEWLQKLVSYLLRGVGLMLNHPVSVAAAWKRYAEQVLKKENI
ncbi:ABC1-domain-containing protein [Rhizoclosmatium globosum]|uniref:ABC1-domain-containing protein n=1 Tax=Rhizoclosmatium globosum TaxID=329046 RepID=A0A1Y2D1C4_9FUNG|nr:ABC1-domain-containing protein [Rhizoclosmatium globosum]|eukprot:ORY52987.1 ABC1-domain-containing protein [Rhizoclosmatium globosum]